MARYIDADRFAERIKVSPAFQNMDWEGQLLQNVVLDLLNNEPTADVVKVKQIEIIRDDLKWWLETNSEKGVVYIPKYVVENMIAKMDSQL